MTPRRFSRPARKSLAARRGMTPRWWHTRDGITRERPPRGEDEDAFERGYRAGLADDTTPEQREAYEQARRAVGSGDVDDLLDVADASGVTPLPEVDGGQLAAELEAWLREQDGGR